jgi:hypothetical protein
LGDTVGDRIGNPAEHYAEAGQSDGKKH